MTEEIEIWKGKCAVYLLDPQTKNWGAPQQTNIGVYQNKKEFYFRIVALGVTDKKPYVNSIMSETWKYTYIKSNFGQFHDSKNLYGLSWATDSDQVEFVSICFKVRDAIPLVLEDEIRREEFEREKQRKIEEEKRKKEEEERRKKEEEERKRQEEEDRKRRQEEERIRKEEEEKRKKEEEEKKRREDQELRASFNIKAASIQQALETLARRLHSPSLFRSVEDVERKMTETENIKTQSQNYYNQIEDLKNLANELKGKGYNVSSQMNQIIELNLKLKTDLQSTENTLNRELDNQKKKTEELRKKKEEEERKRKEEEEKRQRQKDILAHKNKIENAVLNRKKQQIQEKTTQQKSVMEKGGLRTLSGQIEIAKWDIVNGLRDEKSDLIQAVQEAYMKKKFNL